MIEESTAQSGQVYIAALNGTASGGGYELRWPVSTST